ncbi:MAG TPA: hypothetical protein VG844_12765 [Terracidiphilus sp.]|nr:hypothetical protein [Terracidiphilus sp.]
MQSWQSVEMRFLHLVVWAILPTFGTAAVHAQVLIGAEGAEGHPSAEHRALSQTQEMPVAEAGANNAYAAWNNLLRDVARMGMLGAMRHISSSNTFAGGASEVTQPSRGEIAGDTNMNRRNSREGSQFNLASLFQLANDASRGFSASGQTQLGSALRLLPALNQFTRGISLPMNSSFGSFRLSYQSPLHFQGMNGTSLAVHGYGSGLADYESPHMHSGKLDFSASALMGIGTGEGATRAMAAGGGGRGSQGMDMHGGQNNRGGNGEGQPSASVSVRLSF